MIFAMSQTWLAYIPSPPRGVWHLGPLPIRAYAIFIITGIIVALLIGDRRWAARGGQRGVVYDIALWMVPFGLIGGRLYHLATDWQTYWGPGGAGLSAAVRIWDGGLGIWGAVALGVVGAWIGCRRHGVPLPAFIDAVAPGVVLAQAIGRLGNYFNQELYGRETTMPWGLEIFYRRDPAGYVDVHSLDGVSTGQVALVVQPTFLYELIWNVLVFGVLLLLDRRFTLGHGRLFASYVALYCIGRFGVELLRDDTATHIAGIRINTFTSTFVFIGAVVYLILAPKGREDPALLRGRGADDGQEEVSQPEPAEELVTVVAASAATAAGTAGGDAPDGPAEPETEQAAVANDEPETLQAEVAAESDVAESEESEPEDLEGPDDSEPAETVEAEADDVEITESDVQPESAVPAADAIEAVAEERATESEEAGEAIAEEAAAEAAAVAEVADIQPESEAAGVDADAETGQAEAEQAQLAAPDNVPGGHPLLGSDAVVVASTEVHDVAAVDADSESASVEPAESDRAATGEAEAEEPSAAEVVEESPEPEAADVDSAVAQAEPTPSEPEAVQSEDVGAESESEETGSGNTDLADEVESGESDGDDATPPPRSNSAATAGTEAARQRWRLRLRRQRS